MIAIRAARLFDEASPELMPNPTVVIDGARIVEVLVDAPAPAGVAPVPQRQRRPVGQP